MMALPVYGTDACTMVQIYGSIDSELLSGHPMSYKAELLDTLHDFIHEYGAMDGLKSDNKKSKKSFTMKDIFCTYTIKHCQSEHQDSGAQAHGPWDHGVCACPSSYWLLCLLYVIGLLNVVSNSKGHIPLTFVTGEQTDISPHIDFHFSEEVFVEVPTGGEQLA